MSTSVNSQLLLFEPPVNNRGILSSTFVEHRPQNQLSFQIDILLTGHSSQYLDLQRSRLKVKFKVQEIGGKDLEATATDAVAPVIIPLHSFFSQYDIYVQHKQLSTSGNLYPYKAMIDLLMSFGIEAKKSQMESIFYFKDTANQMDSVITSASLNVNSGFVKIFNKTKGSKECELEGVLLSDLFSLGRYLLNEVTLVVRMTQSKDDFRLMVYLQHKPWQGTFKKNPFWFQHFNAEMVSLYVNGQATPHQPFEMDFVNNKFTSAYLSLFTS